MTKIIQDTHVYVVDDQLVVADDIEEAIAVYRGRYTDSEPRKVEQICSGATCMFQNYDALIFRVVEDKT